MSAADYLTVAVLSIIVYVMVKNGASSGTSTAISNAVEGAEISGTQVLVNGII